jgi:hypothetical protein
VSNLAKHRDGSGSSRRVALATRLAMVAVVAAGLGAVAAPGAALANEIGVCTTGWGSSCVTRSVQAKGGNVRIDLYAPSVGACYYKIRDTNNGEVVRNSSFWNVWRETIGGLYSRYRVELYSCPGLAEAHIAG